VMDTSHKTYMYHLPMPTKEDVYVCYPLENEIGGALMAAHEKYEEILQTPGKPLPESVKKEIMANVPGVLEDTLR